jgi:GNAT superfamily N-acetyltransferase
MKKIQKATPKDISLIQEIAAKSWRAHYPGIISHEQIDYMLGLMYSEAELHKHFNNPNYQYYLLGEEENMLGFMGFEFHYEHNTTKLHRIYLLEEAKGKGLGKFALNFLKNEAKSVGDKRIILNVNKENSSYHFYISQNFKVFEEGVFDIGNGYVMDDYLMEFIL